MNSRNRCDRLVLIAISVLLAGCGWEGAPSSNQPATTPKPAAKVYRTPPGRTNPAMAYDPRTREVLMYGGVAGNTPVNDMWAWDGTGWSQLSPSRLPPVAAFAAGSEFLSYMAYDARTSQMVMMARGPALPFGHTWIWDGHNWSELHPKVNPDGSGEIAYDASLGKILMMGSDFSQGNPIGVLWAWDGANWAPIQTPHVVDNPQLGAGSMTYDAVSKQVLYLTEPGTVVSFDQPTVQFAIATGEPRLFFTGSQPTKDITWIFDGQDWTRSPAPTPVGGITGGVQLVYDDATASVLYIGGDAGQTWSWDGTGWHRVSDTAPATFGQDAMGGGATAAYDAARGQVVLFGGITPDGAPMNETWIWDGHTWTKRG